MADLSFDRAIAFARDLIRIPGAPGGEGDVAERVLGELETLGFADARIDATGNVIGRAPGSGGAPAVMLSCHLDVVDPGDPAEWQHGPYSGDLADGFLHGRGAMDIKGPLALQTYAAASFLERPLAGDVIVAHTVLEERGGLGMERLLEDGDVRPGIAIIGESTSLDVCIGHRGRAELVVEVHGLAGHASAPDRARNALDLLPQVLPALVAFAERLPSDDVLGKSSMVATGIETLPTSPNVIPDLARIVIDWRVLPSMTPDSILDDLRRWLSTHVTVPEGWGLEVRFSREVQRTYTGVESDRRLFTPGFLLPPEHPAVRAAAAAVTEGIGRPAAVRPWTFATDGGHVCGVHGIPSIGFAPGEERHAHTNTERLSLAEAETAYRVYPSLIAAVMDAVA